MYQDKKKRGSVRTMTSLTASSALISAILLSGCGSVGDTISPVHSYEASSDRAGDAAQRSGDKEGADRSKSDFPKIADDKRPATSSSKERADSIQGLVADQTHAKHTEEVLRREGTPTRPLGPEAGVDAAPGAVKAPPPSDTAESPVLTRRAAPAVASVDGAPPPPARLLPPTVIAPQPATPSAGRPAVTAAASPTSSVAATTDAPLPAPIPPAPGRPAKPAVTAAAPLPPPLEEAAADPKPAPASAQEAAPAAAASALAVVAASATPAVEPPAEKSPAAAEAAPQPTPITPVAVASAAPAVEPPSERAPAVAEATAQPTPITPVAVASAAPAVEPPVEKAPAVADAAAQPTPITPVPAAPSVVASPMPDMPKVAQASPPAQEPQASLPAPPVSAPPGQQAEKPAELPAATAPAPTLVVLTPPKPASAQDASPKPASVEEVYRRRLAEFSEAPALVSLQSAPHLTPPSAPRLAPPAAPRLAPADGDLHGGITLIPPSHEHHKAGGGHSHVQPLWAYNGSKAAASFELGVINFGEATAALSPQERRRLKEIADVCRENGGHVRIIGHSASARLDVDPRANQEANRQLADRRAEAVAHQLIRLGVQTRKIYAGGALAVGPDRLGGETPGGETAEIYIDY